MIRNIIFFNKKAHGMSHYTIFVRIMLLIGCFPLFLGAMENQNEQRKEIVTLFKGPAPKKKKGVSADYFAKQLLTKVRESYNSNNPEKNSLILNANILTYKPLVEELQKARDEGVNVTILLAQKSFQYGKEKLCDLYNKVPTYVYTNKQGDDEISQDHAKLFLYTINGKHGYSIGSSNMSAYGLFHNSEMNNIIEDDNENYEILLNNLETLQKKSVTYDQFCKGEKNQCSPLRLGNQTLQDTPEQKRTVYTTLSKNFISLLLDRLDDKKFNSGDMVWLSTYTFNSEEITQALVKLLNMGVKVYMYFDKNPFSTNEGFKQIKTLVEKGATVRAYVLEGKKQYIHHAKFLLIHRKSQETDDESTEKKEKKLTLISTQNMLESTAFDALSLDQNETTFDEMQKYIKEYDKDKNFKKVDLENIENLVPKKQVKRKLFLDEEEDNEDESNDDKNASSQNKKPKN